MFPIIAAVVSVVFSVVGLLLGNRQKQQKLKAGELETTAADEGNSITVVFGTVDVSPNVAAFLAGTPQAIKK